MSQKFRNSLFGFNKDDVLSFVTDAKDKESRTQKELAEVKSELAGNRSELETVKSEYADASAKLEAALKELGAFKEKEEQLDRLCDSIGKLYLVAQTNAASIINSAKQSREESERLVESNLAAADDAERRFEEISISLKEKTEQFLNSIDELKVLAAETKETVSKNSEEIENSTEEANRLLAAAGVAK